MKLTVYSQPRCVQCKATYRALDGKNIDYNVIDVSTNDAARERTIAMGHMQAPVTEVFDDEGNSIDNWSGFRPDKVEEYASVLPKKELVEA